MKLSIRTLLFSVLCWAGGHLFAADANSVLDILLLRETLPRVLNSDDIPDLRPTDPQPLFAPSGDFNQDGRPDIAISGRYELPGSRKRYFLLVAAESEKAGQFTAIFFREYDQPVFIHNRGTTGETDPGDQAFSISFCISCEQGWDFYWNLDSRAFETRAWLPKTKRNMVPVEKVPQETADKALLIVADVPDVKTFIDKMKRKGGNLGVEVLRENPLAKTDLYGVRIFEKSPTGDRDYDTLTVNVSSMTIVKRRLKFGKPRGRDKRR